TASVLAVDIDPSFQSSVASIIGPPTLFSAAIKNKRSLLLGDKYPLSTAGEEGVQFTRVIPDSGIELRQMRTFAAVAERRNFTRAADDLHIAQQAVSQQIKALERALGVTLLRRSSRRVELTAEGTVFLADCRRVLAAADRAARRVRAATRGEA